MSEPVKRVAPFTEAELNKIREVNPLWPSYAWIATVDDLQSRLATLTRDLASARTALAEAKGVLKDIQAVREGLLPARLWRRIDALVGGEGGA